MFVSSGQFWYFCECLFTGAAVALVLEVLTPVSVAVKNSAAGHILNFLQFCFVAVAYFFCSTYFKFPSVRAYMPIGVIRDSGWKNQPSIK